MIYSILILCLNFVLADLIHPENNAELNYIHVLFEWEQEPEGVNYNFQLSETYDFSDIIIDIVVPTTVFIEKDIINWGSSYYWRISPIYNNGMNGGWSNINTFYTLDSYFDITTNIIDEDLIEQGYILFGVWDTYKTAVFDKLGKEIWNVDSNEYFITHIDNYGNMFGGSITTSNPQTKQFIHLNFKKELIWSSMEYNKINKHEFKQLPNGNYITLKNITELGPIPIGPWTPLFQMVGYSADGQTNEYDWIGQKIVELDKYTKEEVWSWNVFDFFTKDDYDAYGGSWNLAFNNDNDYDWTHTNALFFDPYESVIYASFRNISRIAKISYPEGEIIWMMGLPSEYMNSGDEHICSDLLFSYQHNIQLLDNGNLLFFDNGNLSRLLLDDFNPTSRIREINVVNNNYCETIFEYELPNGSIGNINNLMSPAMGSVQLLNNGNYLINTIGNGGSIFEVTENKEIVWESSLGLNFPNGNNYRAYKIPDLHPDAYSVIFDNYISKNQTTMLIESTALNINIYNESLYNQSYKYSLSDNNNCFDLVEDDVVLNSNSYTTLTFEYLCNEINNTLVNFNIYPENHNNSQKDYSINFINPNSNNVGINFPGEICISQNYPNPFNPNTFIEYSISSTENIKIILYDINGRKIKILKDEIHNKGNYKLKIFSQNLSSGIYLISFVVNDKVQTKRITLIK